MRKTVITRIVVEGFFIGGVGKSQLDGTHLFDALAQQLAVVELQTDQSEDGQHEHGQYDDVAQPANCLHQRSDDDLQTCIATTAASSTARQQTRTPSDSSHRCEARKRKFPNSENSNSCLHASVSTSRYTATESGDTK